MASIANGHSHVKMSPMGTSNCPHRLSTTTTKQVCASASHFVVLFSYSAPSQHVQLQLRAALSRPIFAPQSVIDVCHRQSFTAISTCVAPMCLIEQQETNLAALNPSNSPTYLRPSRTRSMRIDVSFIRQPTLQESDPRFAQYRTTRYLQRENRAPRGQDRLSQNIHS